MKETYAYSNICSAVIAYAKSKRRYNFSYDETGRALFADYGNKGETLTQFKQNCITPAMTLLVKQGRLTRPMRAIYMFVR